MSDLKEALASVITAGNGDDLIVDSEKVPTVEVTGIYPDQFGVMYDAARSFLRISPDDGEWPEELHQRLLNLLFYDRYPDEWDELPYRERKRLAVGAVLQAVYDYAREESE